MKSTSSSSSGTLTPSTSFSSSSSSSSSSSPDFSPSSTCSKVHNIYHDLFARHKTEDGPNINESEMTTSSSLSVPISRSQTASPITVAQSVPEHVPIKADIEAQEEVVIAAKHDIYGHIATISLSSSDDDLDSVSMEMCDEDSIILTQQQYKQIEDNLKLLLKTISRSTFCRNKIPSALIGHGLLSGSSATGNCSVSASINSIYRKVNKYRKCLRKVYRDRQ